MDAKQLLLAFIEGAGLILSPCILPVLPIVLATSLDGGRARPLGIITGFILAFTAFAFISRQAVLAAGIDSEILRHASLVILMLLGVAMIWPKLSDMLTEKLEGVARLGLRLTNNAQGGGFWRGAGIGGLIGLVWTPCAGPILAAAVIQIVQAQDETASFMTLLLFALGAGLPMLAVTLFGRNLMNRLGFFKKNARILRQALGAIIIVMAMLIYSGADVKFLAALSSENMTEKKGAADARGLVNALQNPYPAAEIRGIESWINSPPLTLQGLKGKVALIDFWTYSCINCVRTLPYLTAWDKKYRDDGLVIIGVHAPEFAFERKHSNVMDAVKSHGIEYPVALDNNLMTWSAFQNKYWPAHYLIDRDGKVVYTHFGEGHYDVTEGNIRALLGISGDNVASVDEGAAQGQTPETYLGLSRADHFASAETVAPYTFPTELAPDHWALSGDWRRGDENITSVSANAALRIHVRAGKAFLVMGSADGQPLTVTIRIDGAILQTLTVDRETLYQVATLPRSAGVLELSADRPGLVAYAFTFGR